MVHQYKLSLPDRCCENILDLESDYQGTRIIQVSRVLRPEIIQWLEEHEISATWSNFWAVDIWFETREDLAAFKLVWQGSQ